MTDYLYLHGFNSSPQSLKARETADWLGKHAPDSRFHCPALSVHPGEAIAQSQALIAALPQDTLLIGSSLGGFYAAWLAQTLDRRAVLINPAIEPHLDLARLPAEQTNPYTGEHYRLDEADMAALMAHRLPQPDQDRFWLVLGSADEVLDWRRAARHFHGCRQTVFNGDDHRLQRWPECLPALPAFAATSRSTP
ncbi:MAG: hypothetical protein JO171_19605 [Paludibacterium sp.]|uniref:YqiA/YcfP family alpha/beta fold hydrolase n=1 Tax=Paludibacterium sp. TaxID=1917523 RepID=UPI0025F005AF|nr:YqiA/YcfP family alpha/beta fold hydrolase [Paludibacterium sp.]MBV8049364.1 hypothetical protein [Paludibacterium sp.]MBV8646701.1 hypothetical protein [Paludibacterium sp.]